MTATVAREVDLAPLLEPIAVNGVVLANRITQSAHHPLYVVEGAMTERYVAYFAARARGGVAVTVTGSASVHRSGGTPKHLAVWREEAVEEHRHLAEAVHEHDGRIFVQLWHGGAQVSGTEWLDRTETPLAASAVPSPTVGRVPKAMDERDLDEVVAAFGEGAAKMREAGIDGVELNGAHGYLLHSFLSPLSNLRTDDHGGDAAGRTRLVARIVAEVRRRCGADYPVGLRMVADEYVGPAGVEPDLALANLAALQSVAPIDYVSLSSGSYHSFERQIPAASSGLEAPLRGHGALVRELVGPGVPVMVANSIREPELAAELLAAGEADLVSMVRAQIADPDLVAKLRTGRRAEVRRCVGANQGCIRRVADGAMMACTVNPHTGREALWPSLPPPARGRRVLVVGGGPAGLKAAAVAAQRGHAVTLVERAERLGGQLVAASSLATMGRWRDLVEDLVADAVRAGVDLRVSTAFEPDADHTAYHDVVLATGSSYDATGAPAARPDLAPRIDPGAHVVGLDTAVGDLAALGDDVLIADDLGDHAALALAHQLAEAGVRVRLVTPAPTPGAVAAATGDLAWLLPRLLALGVVVETGAWPVAVTAGAVTLGALSGPGGPRREVSATALVLNAGRTGDPTTSAPATAGQRIHRIGDCVAPRWVDDALVDAVALARTL